MTANLGTSFVLEDIVSILTSGFDYLIEGVVSVTDGIGNVLANLIIDALSKVEVALINITIIVGSIIPGSGVPVTLEFAAEQVASTIKTLVATVCLIAGETDTILGTVENAETLANAIAALPVVQSVALLLCQGVLILISGALVILTGTVHEGIYTLASAVVSSVQASINTNGLIIGGLEGGVSGIFAAITSSLVGITENIVSDLSQITGVVDSVSVTIRESISNSFGTIGTQVS